MTYEYNSLARTEGEDMFAIDFGARSIKVAKLRKTIEGYVLDNYGVKLSPPDSIINGEIRNEENTFTHNY